MKGMGRGHHHTNPDRSLTLRKAASVEIFPRALRSLFLGLSAALLWQGCGLGPDRVAGTSSGVDNPQLTVAFSDGTGNAALVSGTLSLYREDQNPALDAQPLASLRIDRSAYVNLSGLDFARSDSSQWLSSAEPRGLFKVAAASDSLIAFNVYLRTDNKQGVLATGFRYDAIHRRFLRAADSALTKVILTPKALISVQAAITRSGKSQGLERVFIPGTPFVSVLVEAHFTFEELPEGLFDLKILTGEGKLLPIQQPLNPLNPGQFHVDDSDVAENPGPHSGPTEFSVFAGEDHSAVVESPSFLEGRIEGLQGSDNHASWLWRQIEGPGTPANIRSPTESKTAVSFTQPGLYRFELSAGIGSAIRLDTVLIVVDASFLESVRFIIPFAGQVLTSGYELHISWQGQKEEQLKLQFSMDSAHTFTTLDGEIKSRRGINEYGWKPGNLPETDAAILQLIDNAGNLVVRSGVFSIRKIPLVETLPPQHSGLP